MAAMSYQITVAVKDGTAVVTQSGDVPDGEHLVSGHEDPSQRTLSVVRRGPDGRYVLQASTVHHKEA